MESSLYSEFAIEYFNNVMATYGEIMEDPKPEHLMPRRHWSTC